MHIHILGICGTFMGGIAAIAKQLGHKVTGSDLNVYPPMSTQLENLGIELTQGWDTKQFEPIPDVVIIGNALSRGNPAVEYVLDRKLAYTSGPEWLKNNVLKDRWVLAVAGTHGKTTTSSMLAWILEDAGFDPGYLIGGVPGNFSVSARAGSDPFFVIEADEYDTAFFDKRSKFVHYLPNTLILNNMEFDHADIFTDLDAIKTQFHHLVRTVPGNGLILVNGKDANLADTLERGCWTPTQTITGNGNWQYQPINNELDKFDGSKFNVLLDGENKGAVDWQVTGEHNVSNGLMALAAARHAGIELQTSIASLSKFIPPKRRMELVCETGGVTLYDDFAHHPTAIATTLEGLRNKVGDNRIITILEPRSNTMKMGVHKDRLNDSWQLADQVFLYLPEPSWQIDPEHKLTITQDIENIVQQVIDICRPSDHIVLMSNGGFAGIRQKLTDALAIKFGH